MKGEIVEIEFRPFVCLDCGQLQICADQRRDSGPGNCDSCEHDRIIPAGRLQKMKVTITERARKPFHKGDQ